MLTKKQKQKLDRMVVKYAVGMHKTSTAHRTIIKAWVIRYRCAMEQQIQKQCKH